MTGRPPGEETGRDCRPPGESLAPPVTKLTPGKKRVKKGVGISPAFNLSL